jgi:hypothetical protein
VKTQTDLLMRFFLLLITCSTWNVSIGQFAQVNVTKMLKPGANGSVLQTVSGETVWASASFIAAGTANNLTPSGVIATNYWTLSSGNVSRATGNVEVNANSVLLGAKLAVGGVISAGAGSPTGGSVLLKSNYDDTYGCSILTEYSSGNMGIGAYMYQDANSPTWKSSFKYGALNRGALIVGGDGLKYLTAPSQNVANNLPLTTQPTQVFGVNNVGDISGRGLAVSLGITAGAGISALEYQANGIISTRKTGFGYNVASYPVLQIGGGAATGLSFNYDVSTNTSSAFGGQEIVYKNIQNFLTPNAANTSWIPAFAVNDGKFLIGSFTPNGNEKLQVNGNVQVQSEVKSTGGIMALTTGTNSVQAGVSSNGTFFLPNNLATPTGAIDGRIWTQSVTGGTALYFGKAGSVSLKVATVEEDLQGTYFFGSTNTTLSGNVFTVELDALNNPIIVTAGGSMREGVNYLIRIRRNAINAVTINAAAGYSLGISGIGTLNPTSHIISIYGLVIARRSGTVIFIKD